MILLACDSKDNRIIDLKNTLIIAGMPCAIVGCDSIPEYPMALAVFTFTKSENYLNTVSLRCKRTPLIAVNESGSRIYNNDVLFCESGDTQFCAEYMLNFIKAKYGITAGEYLIDDVSVRSLEAVSGVSRVSLTPVEYRILSLLVICKGKCLSESIIGKVCFEDHSKSCRVPVHICNLNKKCKTVFGYKLITAKRGLGYSVN